MAFISAFRSARRIYGLASCFDVQRLRTARRLTLFFSLPAATFRHCPLFPADVERGARSAAVGVDRARRHRRLPLVRPPLARRAARRRARVSPPRQLFAALSRQRLVRRRERRRPARQRRHQAE